MKKALAVLLALIMVLSLVACGGNGDDGNTSAPPTDASTSPGGSPSAPSGGGDGGGSTEPSTPATSLGEQEYGGTLRIVNTSEGATPLGVPWEVIGIDVNLITPYGESLVLERTNGDIEPWLATSWEIDTEGLTITFQLRDDVYFTDGSKFNADVAAWNLQNAIDASVMNPAIVKASAIDEYVLLVELDRWANSLFAGFASHSFAMISKEAFEANGIEWARENPTGTGPFKLKNYIHGEKIIYEKNENYWQDGKPYLDEIEFVFIRDTMTQNVALQATGDQSIDVLNTNSGEQMATLQNLDVYIDSMSIGPVSLIPSSVDENDPLSKLEVRQAISYAINRDALVAARGFGYLTAATQFIPDTWGAHLPDSYNVSYNQEKAKQLLADAGYPNGFSTTLYAMPGMVDRDIVVAVQDMLKAVGIDAAVEFPDSGGYSNLRYNGWENGMLVQHTRSLTAILSTFSLYFDATLDAETNELYYLYMASCWRPKQEMYDALQAAGRAPEPDDALLQECHRIIMENMVCIPLYNIQDGFIIKNNVHDTGFSQWGSGTMFLPSEAWKSSN